MEVSISGAEAAFGATKSEYIELDPAPALLIIPIIAIVVLLALSVPSLKSKLEQNAVAAKFLPVVAGAVGLIALLVAHLAAVGKLRKDMDVIDISSLYSTGFGFRASVVAFIVMAAMPFIDDAFFKSKGN
jgi:hypothetical protein